MTSDSHDLGPDQDWRKEARARFPDIQEEQRRTYRDEPSASQWLDSPFSLWIEMTMQFDRAYEGDDMERVAAIYQFADWCSERSEDLANAVAVCFHEHIPTNEKALRDMPRWFTLADVLHMRGLFSYLVGHEGFLDILSKYPESSWLSEEPSSGGAALKAAANEQRPRFSQGSPPAQVGTVDTDEI